ncbi:MAG: chromosome segregation protein SMC [Acidimicrobiia bacterium]
MFLKSLTLRGFKSFADKTVLEFEPGVMVVVGPNGSGKSNLVDAVAWVLGAQGPRSLRGGKMDDVIFAGTADRPALGRAEVSLTIDNSAALLPIEFSEVTITRTLFRNGDSEYAINGAPCRLLDIQELLSDSGIGRQQHVIVGQGQLDTILNSRPEDRRAVIEEAAGILKYRKRREKAERRLEATEGNLIRLNDLLREVRRGLGPLQKQADAARRHDGVVAELGAIRLHLSGRELAGLQLKTTRLREQASELVREEAAIQGRLRELDVSVLDAERALTDVGHGDVGDALVRVESMRERARGVRALVVERRRGLERELAAAADEGVVETLVADAGAVRAELDALEPASGALAEQGLEVEQAEREISARRAAFTAAADGDDPVAEAEAVRRELSARRDGLVRIEEELARFDARAKGLEQRREQLAFDLDAATERLRSVESTVPSASEVASAASIERRRAEEDLAAAEARVRDAESEAGKWQGRADALAQALDAASDAEAASVLEGMVGVAGALVNHLVIEPGAERAVAAALGDAMGSLIVSGRDEARGALERLAAGDTSAWLLVLDAAESAVTVGATLAPIGTRSLASCVRASLPGLQATLARTLAGVVLADGDWRAAMDVAVANPDLTVMTRAGDRFSGGRPWRFGGEQEAGVTRAALDEAVAAAERAVRARDEARTAVERARATVEQRREAEQRAAEAARAARTQQDKAQSLADRLASERNERAQELEHARATRVGLVEALSAERARLLALEARVPELEAAEADAQRRADERAADLAELEARETAIRQLRREHAVKVASVEERRAMLTRRLGEVEHRLARDPEAKVAAERYRQSLLAKGTAYEALGAKLDELTERIDTVLASLREERRIQAEKASEAGGRLEQLRGQRQEQEQRLAGVRERQQRRDVEEAENRMRLEAAVEKIRAEFDCEPGVAINAASPEVPEGTTLAGRARDLDRDLRLMGPINPLALEEYEALQERHDFLVQQLDDVKNSRRELQRVIKAVDLEIVTVFEAAFADVQQNFEQLFSTLFPGGSGRVFLTDPGDLLNTGIEMEARPSGKNTKRLSLLSGGERSLTAMAFLFAVFRSRPSPFYLLDEVEAALDDVNLHRFLDLVHEFRNDAQLVIVSHQKRTMEAGDCLYGVSMAPGGSTKVVSQRMRGEIVLN